MPAPRLHGPSSASRSLAGLSTPPALLVSTVRPLQLALRSLVFMEYPGNFGQANYSAAKMGLIAFTKTLDREGAKYNIKATAIAPVRRTREFGFSCYLTVLPTDGRVCYDGDHYAPRDAR